MSTQSNAGAGVGACPESYYAASAHPAPERLALTGQVEADIGIVGAGYTGLSAGFHPAKKVLGSPSLRG